MSKPGHFSTLLVTVWAMIKKLYTNFIHAKDGDLEISTDDGDINIDANGITKVIRLQIGGVDKFVVTNAGVVIASLSVEDLTITGHFVQQDVLQIQNMIIGDDATDILTINSTLRNMSGILYMKYAGPDGDQYIYFYQGGSPTGASIKWDDTLAQFVFSHPISGISEYLPIIVDYGTALPAPSATYEGRPGTIRGDAIHRSRTYWCERSDAQVFQWVEFVNGGA